MQRSVNFLATARREFQEQLKYLSEHASRKVAARYVLALRASLNLLAEMPELGSDISPRRSRLKGVRVWSVRRPFQKYQIYYRFQPARIEVLHVVHGARDMDPIV